jgi:exosortase A-associated hydrolase 1
VTLREEAVTFDCGGEPLIGILSRGASDLDTAVVVVVGGPQYRAGSHRQFVLLARRLAAAGHAVLRFDYRGMGDSGGPRLDFTQVGDDIAAAVAALRRFVPGVQHVVLWGLCDGASAALLHCAQASDGSIAGLCLLNPWVRSEASLARTHVKHYYLDRLKQREFWTKLLTGKLARGTLAELAHKLALAFTGSTRPSSQEPKAPFQNVMADAWKRFDGPILLLLSAEDYTAKEFLECCAGDPAWRGALQRPSLERHDLPGADHTVSDADSRARMEALTLSWLQNAVAARGSHSPGISRALGYGARS